MPDLIGYAGMVALAASSFFPNLTHLNVSSNGFSDAGMKALAAASFFPNLTFSGVYRNEIGDAGNEGPRGF